MPHGARAFFTLIFVIFLVFFDFLSIFRLSFSLRVSEVNNWAHFQPREGQEKEGVCVELMIRRLVFFRIEPTDCLEQVRVAIVKILDRPRRHADRRSTAPWKTCPDAMSTFPLFYILIPFYRKNKLVILPANIEPHNVHCSDCQSLLVSKFHFSLYFESDFIFFSRFERKRSNSPQHNGAVREKVCPHRIPKRPRLHTLFRLFSFFRR